MAKRADNARAKRQPSRSASSARAAVTSRKPRVSSPTAEALTTALAKSLAPRLSLGLDIEHVARVEKLLEQHPTRFLDRVFTPGEVAHSKGRRNRAQHLAARFACKEAVMKALGTGLTSGITWRDIEVVSLPSGKPVIKLTGNASKIANARGLSQWEVTLSHTKDVAAAVVIAW